MSLSQRLPYEWLLGWRYTRAGRATRRNGFISFISAASMLGIALGVAALALSNIHGAFSGRRRMQRKPIWLVELSMACACRAAGR